MIDSQSYMFETAYFINFHTGTGNMYGKNLTEAKSMADRNAGFTQRNISIENSDGKEICRRNWYGVEYNKEEDDCEDPILFGTFGFYGDWTDDLL